MSTGEPDPEVEAFIAGGAGRGPAADYAKETPIAKVFLSGDTAWKVLKPVDFGFLDYATLERRRWAMERGLAMNRAVSGDIYRGVHPVTRDEDGALALGGAGETVEWVLEMRRFDEAAILANTPALLDGPAAERLGRDVARLHEEALVRPEGGGVHALGFTIASNAEQLRALAPALGAAEVEALILAIDARFAELAPLLESRRVRGFARLCHGDLHLANIVVEDGRAIPFDCIEFNDRLSEIDVLYDIAFLLMDLGFHERAEAASRAFSGWLDASARTFGDGVWMGLRALPLFLAVRAAVRAHVTAHGDPALGRRYLRAALDYLAPKAPVLAAVGGLSGSGKSTVARALALVLRCAPGAVVLRSDEVRKRLWGRGPFEPLPPEAYAPEAGERTYAALMSEARSVLRSGHAVVLDATFLRPGEREAAERLAYETGVSFLPAWLEASAEVLRARVAARTGDASDADVAVLETQLAIVDPAVAWPRLDARAPATESATAIVSSLEP